MIFPINLSFFLLLLLVNFIFSYLAAFPDRHFYFPKTPVGALVPHLSNGQRIVSDPIVAT